MVHCMFWGATGYNFQKQSISLKIDFVLTNSADPDEMPHYAAFHQDLYCIQSTELKFEAS